MQEPNQPKSNAMRRWIVLALVVCWWPAGLLFYIAAKGATPLVLIYGVIIPIEAVLIVVFVIRLAQILGAGPKR